MVIIGRLKSWMPPFQLAKAQIERCLSDRLRILQEKGVLKVCGCGCSMMLAGRSLNITVCGGLLPAFWLFLSVQWLSVLSFLPSGEWKSANVPFTISKQSFSVQWSQTSPPFGDMNEMKRWCFSKALGFSSKNIAVNLSYTQQISSSTYKIVHGDSCYSMVNSTTITTVIVNSYSYDTRTIC